MHASRFSGELLAQSVICTSKEIYVENSSQNLIIEQGFNVSLPVNSSDAVIDNLVSQH